MKMRINTQSMQFSRYMVSTTIFIIPLLGGYRKDVAGAGLGRTVGKRCQQDLFQVTEDDCVSGFGKGGGNLVPVHL